MPNPISSRVDDPYRSCQSNPDDDASSVAASTSSEPGIHGPQASAHAEDGDYYAGAFMLRGRDPRTGLEAEVFSASIHQGEREHAVQAGMARMGASTDDGHFAVRGEVFTAQAHAGVDNADGSTGFGASMGSAIVGGEVTGTWGPVSLTFGAAAGATVGASAGVRDSDHDGKIEYCGRVDFGVGSIGACVEKRW
jgi:hypothetical protein